MQSEDSHSKLCLYHRVPHNLAGSILYPLNALKQKFPALYAAHAQKYVGREALTQQMIPSLGCLWNDVLHFSPVHPNQIRRGLVMAGFEPKSTQWFKVDPFVSNFTPKNATIYLSSPKQYLDFNKSTNEFRRFSYEALAEFSELPEATVFYYQACQQEGKSPLLFHRIPHILYRGSLNLSNATIISI